MKHTFSFLLLISVLITAACSGKPGKEQEHGQVSEPEIKVLSYNIHHANPPSEPDLIDLEAIAAVILESGADLVAVQEVDVHTERSGKESHQAEELAKLTGMSYFFSKGIDYQGGEYGTAILSKYPISDAQRHELPNLEGVNAEPRTLAVVTVTINDKEIKFANTHLDYTNSENNLLQVQRILEIFENETFPILLAGDFNAMPESISIQTLDEKFTRSCLENCAFTSPQENPRREIDFIMVSKDAPLEVIAHEVIEEIYASDHRPVFAKYRWTE